MDFYFRNLSYILLLPGTFDYGFSVTLQPKSDSSKKYFKQRTTSFTLNSNDLWKLGDMATTNTTEVSENTIPYITLSASETHTISLVEGASATGLQYSVGGGSWADMTAGVAVSYGGLGNELRLRAINQNGIYGESSENQFKVFTFGDESGEVECTGDIRTLIDYENYYDANTSEAKFNGLFYDFTQLKSAPKLPMMELSNSCYYQMFYGCTSFTEAPELPATTLASNCYDEMFNGCSSLTTAPSLRAENLANYCYSYMFNNCTSLTSAPALPAVTLADFCYYRMFYGCKELTSAPELKALTLQKWCYFFMFYGCSKLEKVTMLATNISAEGCLRYWLSDAGTEAPNRTLKLASLSVYNEMLGNTDYLYDKWKQGVTNTTVEFQNP